ncbi:MAG TPA: hypothetical protein VFJ14_13820 [Nocardioidaceae bacterium]|nr:hypothetical protein [Nocardioidaceae bacterium]
MSETIASDRRATWHEVAARRVELRRHVEGSGLTNPRLRGDGAVIVQAPEAGYRAVGRFAAQAAQVVGTYVHVLTDDVPAAGDAPPL